jgi:hypothetical protein
MDLSDVAMRTKDIEGFCSVCSFKIERTDDGAGLAHKFLNSKEWEEQNPQVCEDCVKDLAAILGLSEEVTSQVLKQGSQPQPGV